MEPTDSAALAALTDEQIKRLAVIVLEEFRPGLDRTRFNDVACFLFEDVPGFELMTPRQLMAYMHTMWVWERDQLGLHALSQQGLPIQSIVEWCSIGTESLPLTVAVLSPSRVMQRANVGRQIGKMIRGARGTCSGLTGSERRLVFMADGCFHSRMPKVVVIAGPNGAGKSTTAPAILRNAWRVREFVNADTIAAGLSAFSPETVAITAGRFMLDRVRELARERRDFAFETTLASKSFAPWLKNLRADGYTFHLAYLWLPTVELAVARVAERVRRGGHAVPEDIIRRRYDRSLTNFFALYSTFADSWVMLDNSIRRRPRLIAKRAMDWPVEIFDKNAWCALRTRYGKERSDKG